MPINMMADIFDDITIILQSSNRREVEINQRRISLKGINSSSIE